MRQVSIGTARNTCVTGVSTSGKEHLGDRCLILSYLSRPSTDPVASRCIARSQSLQTVAGELPTTEVCTQTGGRCLFVGCLTSQ